MILQLKSAFCFYKTFYCIFGFLKPFLTENLVCLAHCPTALYRQALLYQLRLKHVMGMQLGLNKVIVYLCHLKELQGYLVQGY